MFIRSVIRVCVPKVDPYLKLHGGGNGLVGTLEQLHCVVGSKFMADEEVATIETDKVSIAVFARQAGVVTKVLTQVGDPVAEDQTIYEALSCDVNVGEDAGRHWQEKYLQQRRQQQEAGAEESRRVALAWLRKRHSDQRRRSAHNRHEWSRRHQWWKYQHWRQHRWQQEQPGKARSSSAWKVLKLQPGASPTEIKAAFRKLALKYHPDHNPNPAAASIFRKILAAYEALINVKK
mmetsp:Transcript_35287/g.69222  ORF Transcript_35287/g.69222 Transcript_35287/m.69222 type:complete len:234 (-) Transcript_35287:9-710(-)